MTDGSGGGGGFAQYFDMVWAALLGAVGAIIGIARWTWTVRDQLAKVEQHIAKIEAQSRQDKTETVALIDKKITDDRHNNIYPTIHKTAVIPLERLEDEVKKQGQNIAILMDRDNYAALLRRITKED